MKRYVAFFLIYPVMLLGAARDSDIMKYLDEKIDANAKLICAAKHDPYFDQNKNEQLLKKVKCALLQGANPNARKLAKESYTPLGEACRRGNLECARLLLEAKASVNGNSSMSCPDTGSYTPLMLAAQSSEMVKLLLSHKADPNARDRNGRTALDCARSGYSHAAVSQLEEAQASGKQLLGDRSGETIID